jgi:hypothetical protein
MAASVNARPALAAGVGKLAKSTVMCVLCNEIVSDGGPRVEHGVCRRCHPIALEGVLNRLLLDLD